MYKLLYQADMNLKIESNFIITSDKVITQYLF